MSGWGCALGFIRKNQFHTEHNISIRNSVRYGRGVIVVCPQNPPSSRILVRVGRGIRITWFLNTKVDKLWIWHIMTSRLNFLHLAHLQIYLLKSCVSKFWYTLHICSIYYSVLQMGNYKFRSIWFIYPLKVLLYLLKVQAINEDHSGPYSYCIP